MGAPIVLTLSFAPLRTRCNRSTSTTYFSPLARSIRVHTRAEKGEVAVVSYKPRVRQAGKPLEVAPVVHSTAYLVKGNSRTSDFKSDSGNVEDRNPTNSADFTGNALEWALHKADEQLNQMEHSNSGVNKTAMDIVKGPAGQVTLRTMQGFATVAAAAGPQVMKVALPIGKQLFALGAKGLVAGVAALDSNGKDKKSSESKQKTDQARKD